MEAHARQRAIERVSASPVALPPSTSSSLPLQCVRSGTPPRQASPLAPALAPEPEPVPVPVAAPKPGLFAGTSPKDAAAAVSEAIPPAAELDQDVSPGGIGATAAAAAATAVTADPWVELELERQGEEIAAFKQQMARLTHDVRRLLRPAQQQPAEAARRISFGEDQNRVLEVDVRAVATSTIAAESSAGSTPRLASDGPALVEGWMKAVSRATGEVYYTHAASGETQWEPPLLANYDIDADRSGWIKKVSSTTGKPYWFNAVTGESVWERPHGNSHASAQAAQQRRKEPASGAGAFACCAAPTGPAAP
jgi:hypothetical protein